jgi:Concanavalin A-like lectin/glucanases superfamily
MQYVATRSFRTRRRGFAAGDPVDLSVMTDVERVDLAGSGAFVQARFVGTAAELSSRNEVVGAGLVAWATDTGEARIGDGVSRHDDLDVVGTSSAVATALAADPAFTDTYAAKLRHSTTPEAHGAVGNDPAHDDAPGIEAAIASVVAACIADQSYVCEVVFSAESTYYALRDPVKNPTINGAESHTYAQIALPYIPWTYIGGNPLVTLILKTTGDGRQGITASFVSQPCAIQTTVVASGTFTPGQDATYGCPSVLGGPAYGQTGVPGLPNKSGLCVVMDGVNIVAPQNPALAALDFYYIDAVQLGSVAVYVPTAGFVDPAACTHPKSWGVQFPATNNGGVVRFDSLRVVGFYSGIRPGEHVEGQRYETLGNRIAIEPIDGVQSAIIQRFDDVHNEYGIASNGGADGNDPITVDYFSQLPTLVIGMWYSEFGSSSVSYRIFDTKNQLAVSVTNYIPTDNAGDFAGSQAQDTPMSIAGGAGCYVRDAFRSWDPFLPTDIRGLEFWFDSKKITTLPDTANVPLWPDGFNSSYDASQGTAGSQPTYQMNVYNGRPVVRFDGVDDALTSSRLPTVKPFTVMALVRPTDIGGNHAILDAADGGLEFRIEDTTGRLQILEHGVAVIGSSTGTADANVFVVVGVTYSATGEVTFYWNGTAETPTTNDVALVTATETVIGGVTEHFHGDIVEVVKYSAVLTPTQIARLCAYLAR